MFFSVLYIIYFYESYFLLKCEQSTEFLVQLASKTDQFPSQEDLSGAAVALLRLQDTYALSTEHLARGDVEGVTDTSSMTG